MYIINKLARSSSVIYIWDFFLCLTGITCVLRNYNSQIVVLSNDQIISISVIKELIDMRADITSKIA